VTWKPKLRTVLLAVVLLAALVGGAAAATVRLYRGELIRRTESALVGEGAAVQAAFRRAVADELERSSGSHPPLEEFGVPANFDRSKQLENWLKPGGRPFRLRGRDVAGVAPGPKPATERLDPVVARLADQFAAQLEMSRPLARSEVTVVDYRGTIVTGAVGEPGESLLHREEIRKALNGKLVQKVRVRPSSDSSPAHGSLRRRADYDVCVAMPIAEEGRLLGAVLLSKPPLSMPEVLFKHRALFSGLLLVVLTGLLAASFVLVYLVRDPVEALLGRTDGTSK